MTSWLDTEIKILSSLSQVSAPEWHSLQNPGFPFTDYAFLHALEQTDCLGARTGWKPLYITFWGSSKILGALILYSKTNSYGEYIFDFGWAQAYESSGLDYYPKLTSAIPFTPATGSKILLDSSLSAADRQKISSSLLKKANELATEMNVSSLHFLFIPKNEIDLYARETFFLRHSFQYHWRNHDYSTFEAFLESLRSKRRREITRERSQVLDQAVKIQRLTGNEIKPRHAEIMYQFYSRTIEKMGGHDYLTADFFKLIFQTMSQKILLVLATDHEDREVAGALNFIGEDALFGRYWGCLDEYRALHFEVCYYQGIEFCIQKKLSLFEAGAQGEHKFQRGFMPALTYSAHLMRHPGLDRAIQDFVEHEKGQIERIFQHYRDHSPFSRSSGGSD